MKLLKCSDCGKEVSINSEACPNCGSKQQFKNHVFMRKELSKDGVSSSEMMNFQKHGGKIKLLSKKAKYIIAGLIVGYFGLQMILKELEPKQLMNFEGQDLMVNVIEAEILNSLKDIKPYKYDLLKDKYEELLSEDRKDFYKEKIKYYEKIDSKSSLCTYNVIERDKSSLNFKDSYDREYNGFRSGGTWTDTYTYYFPHKFKAKNAFGMESTIQTENVCRYDKDFNLIDIQKIK